MVLGLGDGAGGGEEGGVEGRRTGATPWMALSRKMMRWCQLCGLVFVTHADFDFRWEV